jgi:DNA-binding response OmpR family regulator
MKALLLVEDDTSLGATLQERLQREGYGVEWAQSLNAAVSVLDGHIFDLIIVDVGLPDGSGFDLARRVRLLRGTPFIFMTAMNTAENRLEGYEIGAEEFIPKPFHLKELLLRVGHVLQTHQPLRQVPCGDVLIDLDAMTLMKGGQVLRPASRDFRLLRFLIECAPRVVSRDEILDKVWGEDKFPSTRTIDNAVMRLRQELGDTRGEWIRSVRGIGYQWAGQNE